MNICVEKQAVEEAQSIEERPRYRNGYSSDLPNLERVTEFKLAGNEYFLAIDDIDRDFYWPEFIESGDELTFFAQKRSPGWSSDHVVAYVNHSKGTGIQMCDLGGFIIFIMAIFAVIASTHLVFASNVSRLGYGLSIPMLVVFLFSLVRYIQRVFLQRRFSSYIKERYPELSFSEYDKKILIAKSNRENVVLDVPTRDTVSENCSQQRFIDSSVDRMMGSHEAPNVDFDNPNRVRRRRKKRAKG